MCRAIGADRGWYDGRTGAHRGGQGASGRSRRLSADPSPRWSVQGGCPQAVPTPFQVILTLSDAYRRKDTMSFGLLPFVTLVGGATSHDGFGCVLHSSINTLRLSTIDSR